MNISQWPHSLPFIYLSHVGLISVVKLSSYKLQNFLEVVNLIYTVRRWLLLAAPCQVSQQVQNIRFLPAVCSCGCKDGRWTALDLLTGKLLQLQVCPLQIVTEMTVLCMLCITEIQKVGTTCLFSRGDNSASSKKESWGGWVISPVTKTEGCFITFKWLPYKQREGKKKSHDKKALPRPK